MPRKAPTNCKRAMCPGVVRDGICSVCGDHRKEKRKRYDSKRKGVRYADRRWRKLRRMVLAAQPLCADCQTHGRTTLATDVHHIVAKKDGGTDAWDNLQALCHSCHSRRTARGE